VPSISAANLDDLLTAQGFVTAQDRLWQMDMLRRHAAGNLAEILGSNLVEHDRTQRTLQIRAAADRAIAALPADQHHQLEEYSRGVNAYITQAADHLPVEFHFLHYKPAPWTPRDCLLVSLAMFQDLSTEFPTKIRREAFAAHLPPELLADLYPVGSWRDHPPTQPSPDLTLPVPEVEQIPLDRSQSRLATPEDILHLAHQFSSQDCSECRAGSNNWAVSASRSASGSPLVSNDMHLHLDVPDIWYEATLHAAATSETPALDASGFALPGVPFIIVGRNQHVAWSFTNLGGDVQDVRIEHLRGSGANTEFQHPDGSWSPVLHHKEHIIVRGGHDIDLDVLATTETIGPAAMPARAADVSQIETPIISAMLPSERRTLSLAWTIYDPSNVTSPFLAINTANSGSALVAAFSNFGGPSLNLIYADDQKHIGYHALGAIPIRGPADQHPRLAAPTVTIGPPPPDEDSDDAETTDSTPPNPSAAPQLPATQPVPTLRYSIGSPISPLPVDAIDASQIWSGYIAYNELPSIVDPANGILATANARITPDDYPYYIANNWAPPYRVERINKVLAGRTGLTSADMLSLQNDVHSEADKIVAQRLAYALDHLSSAEQASDPAVAHDAARLHQAADLLRAWDGSVSPNSAAPTIVFFASIRLWHLLLGPQIDAHDFKRTKHHDKNPEAFIDLYQWGERTYALEELLQHTPARWLPPGFTNWNDLLAASVEHSLKDFGAPSNLSAWRFGPAHPVDIAHPVFSMLPFFDELLGVPTGSGKRSTGGDYTTIHAIGPQFGASERFTADLSNPDGTLANITTGESGNPASPNYLDQLPAWLAGSTFKLPLISAPQPTHTLTLLP